MTPDGRAGPDEGAGSPPHGFADTDETRRLLRSRPPEQALAWVARQVGAPVASVRPLLGGMSSAVHLLTVVAPAGETRPAVVLRRYVRPEDGAGAPDRVGHEARALRVAAAMSVPTPELVALDRTGAEAGAPALLMTSLPGRVDWSPPRLDRWLGRLAALLPPVHEAGVPPPGVLPRFVPYPQDCYAPPKWSRHPRTWERAVELAHAPPPFEHPVVVHRDFHPGNVLWRRGKVTGLVDWHAASVGPASVDVGHCRVNLLRFGLEAAERFTHHWEQLSGARYHPWADVATIVGFLDVLRDEPGSDGHHFEELLTRAVAELGPVPGGPPEPCPMGVGPSPTQSRDGGRAHGVTQRPGRVALQ